MRSHTLKRLVFVCKYPVIEVSLRIQAHIVVSCTNTRKHLCSYRSNDVPPWQGISSKVGRYVSRCISSRETFDDHVHVGTNGCFPDAPREQQQEQEQ